MKFKCATIKNFKRFTDLKIQDVPDTARLIILVGPNGSGKSSFFDALSLWQSAHTGRGLNTDGENRDYYGKVYAQDAHAINMNNLNVEFHDDSGSRDARKCIYVRSAYRNDPDFTGQIGRRGNIDSLLDVDRHKRMIDNEMSVGQNYQWLAGQALQDIFDVPHPENMTVADFQNRVIGDIKGPIAKLFTDLELRGLANPSRNGTFRFDRGESKGFPYKNLSGGQKAAFDLILDFCVARREYDDTLFCIDEPEAHLSTRLQAKLLDVLYGTMPPDCQLMLATHSIGMMRRAMDIGRDHPGAVVFLDFGDRDFDNAVIIKPAIPNRRFWRNAYDVALDDLAALVAPNHIIICEGEPITKHSGPNHGYDAECYNTIFGDAYPDA